MLLNFCGFVPYKKSLFVPYRGPLSPYGWNPNLDPEVLDHLATVSWMDSINGWLREITDKESLLLEDSLKIKIMKHSIAHTVVEHAADTRLMSKVNSLNGH